MMLLNLKTVAIVIVFGALMNLVIYRLDSEPGASVSGWRPTTLSEFNKTNVTSGLRQFLGVANASVSTVPVAADPVAEEAGRFVYGGITYRLSGLVVAGIRSSTTLISDNDEVIRLELGDALPSGGTIYSINLNELVVENSEGNREPIKIYR